MAMPDPRKNEGDDVAGCVWISMPTVLSGVPVRNWLASTRMAKVPMEFVFGEKDVAGGKNAKGFVLALKGAGKLPDATKAVPVKDSKAVGSDLLKGSLSTSDDIATFCKNVVERRNVDWEKHMLLPVKQPLQLAPYFSLR
jgi:hypothetical protein